MEKTREKNLHDNRENIKRKYDRRSKNVFRLALGTALISGIVSIGGAIHYTRGNPYLDSHGVVMHGNMTESIRILEDVRESLSQLSLPYTSGIEQYLQTVYSSNEERIASLDSAISSIRNDRERLEQTNQDFLNYDAFQNNNRKIGLNLMVYGLGAMLVSGIISCTFDLWNLGRMFRD